ncbi:MAG: Plug and carboxypeptidase regulatory-like domain-containing protein, partial [Acidobacteria bacterium]|nr:Plug and carboxypeptidase regulatory-like domain-containing protein [Acidobacteriota bacterium]MCI0723933.1 Plug and carboxypeptidase regulatory-like domain-containing protein [Acidobacteriota bacterium]
MSLSKRSAVLISVVMMAVALFPPTVCAQTTGTIYGQVKDASDAVVAGATVKGRNLGTTLVRSAVTNAEGSYLIPSLPPGNYEVTMELPGFKTFVQSGITLRVGENAQVNAALQVGEVTEKINVESENLKVDTHSTTLGTTVDNRRLNKIPLNGRNIYSLALLVPGIGVAANIAAAKPDGRNGVTLSVSGNRDESNNILLDGTGMLDAMSNYGVNLPNPDALQEFRVLTSTFSAEYGRAAAGVFIAVTKSGTNEIHGSLYEFLRNDNLNASNFFTPGRVPKLAQNQFGGTVGGPLIKNKTFLFGSYQGIRISQENITSYFPPTAAERRGDFSASGKTIRDPDTGLPFPGNIIPQARFDPLTLKVMNEFIELPNLPDGRYQELFSTPTNGNEFTIKGDHQLTSA